MEQEPMAAHGCRVGGIISDMRLPEELEGLLQQPFPSASFADCEGLPENLCRPLAEPRRF